ncbi:PD-(D/E)XK nuclease superfamily protein [Caballeronia catudaia]|uniref:PD-(D/E)XK nuclease superfamily protein n=1 Tax=Caballeronia catudaia TaxID=1777136 RepID=A0A158CLU7_9BURK|nr:DUF2800 domain-containing protein [Caballeronia catudaia]SAK83363.1 PD-(D/E)XK nuclease superfamily protein [Caballeronia catudaia]
MNTPVASAQHAHARLSPSSAYSWIACPASAAAQLGQPDESSEYADEGTAAHTLMQWCLDKDADANAYLGRVISVGEREFEVDDEMADAVQRYVDGVRERIAELTLAGAKVQMRVEARLSIEHVTGEPDAKGTSDTVLIAHWPDNTAEIEIRDLKYGRGVEVQAEENWQAMLYAAAAHETYASLFDIATINLVIHQPRLTEQPSEWRLKPAALLEWIDTVARPAAERAMQVAASAQHTSLQPADFHPGEKACRFCRAKATCPALATYIEDTIRTEFEVLADMTEADVKTRVEPLDNAALGRIFPALPLIEQWGRAVLARIENELMRGHAVPGAKLVQGRRGARQWSSVEDAEKLLKAMRVKHVQMYVSKLISPTQAEKLLARDYPRRWKRVEALVSQREGAPSVAPDSDKRPTLVLPSPADEFGIVTEDDGLDLV